MTRESYGSLEEAIGAMDEQVARIRDEGGLETVSVFRTYEPGDQIQARLEISTGGLFRRHDAGVDVMGDGAVVPFRGGVTRKPLPPGPEGSPIEAVRLALGG